MLLSYSIIWLFISNLCYSIQVAQFQIISIPMKANKIEYRYPKSRSLCTSFVNSIVASQNQKIELMRSLQKLIYLSTKTNDPSIFLKQQLFQMNHLSNYLKNKKKQHKIFIKKQTINHLERAHQKFFIPPLQANAKNKLVTTIEPKLFQPELSVQQDEVENEQSYNSLSPLSSLKITKYQQQQRKRGSLKRSGGSIDSADNFQTKKKKNYQASSKYKQFIRKSNTFLFSLPTMQGPKKRSSTINEEIVYPWQENLMETLNYIQETSIKSKPNLKIEREKLSSFLKKNFINEIITTYYKCDLNISFQTVKAIVQDLMKLNRKEATMIAFFTYDVNNDGFICEEDIYFFIEKLPFDAKIMQDFNLMIEFFRKNKVRSTETNLPKKLLERKQKTIANEIWNEGTIHTIKSLRQKKRQKVVRKFFSLINETSEQPSEQKRIPFYKKFQINFDVFSLIFAERRPVLISELIKRFIERPTDNFIQKIGQELYTLNTKTQPTEQFLYTRSQSWKKMMEKSEQLRSVARNDKDRLTHIFQRSQQK